MGKRSLLILECLKAALMAFAVSIWAGVIMGLFAGYHAEPRGKAIMFAVAFSTMANCGALFSLVAIPIAVLITVVRAARRRLP
jgi:hypothetical protein